MTNRPPIATTVALVFLCAQLGAPLEAHGQSQPALQSIELLGHRLTQFGDGYPKELRLDGKKIAEESIFRLDLRTSVAGYEIAVVNGDSSGGSCADNREYLIAVKPGSEPELHVVNNQGCWQSLGVAVEHPVYSSIDGDKILIRQNPIPGQVGQLWAFDPSRYPADTEIGPWVYQGDLSFAPQPGTTLDNLRRKRTPIDVRDILNNAETYASFIKLAGPKADKLMITDTGGGSPPRPERFEDGRYSVSYNCAAHTACTQQIMIALDLQSGAMFIGFKPPDELDNHGKIITRNKIELFPSVGAWPAPARQKLSQWAKQWPDDR